MRQPPISATPERDRQILVTFERYLANGTPSTDAHHLLADTYGITASRVRHIIPIERRKRLAESAQREDTALPLNAVPDGFYVKRLNTHVDENGQTQEQWLRSDIDSQKMSEHQDAIPQGHGIKGVSTYLNEQGKVRGQWIKTDRQQQDWLDIVNGVLQSIPSLVTPLPPISKPKVFINDFLALYPLADLHLGMYSSLFDAERNWRLTDAVDVFKRCIDDLVARTPKAAHAIIGQIGDFTHVDNQTNATPTSGARLDVDGRFVEISAAAFDVAIHAINRVASHHQNVSVVWLGGNHDPNTARVMQAALAMMYRNNERVRVHVSGKHTHCIQHGQVALGFTHGDTMKPKDLIHNMAVDYPAIWAATTYRIFHTGHLHHKKVEEFPGGIVECHESPAPRDEWSELHGYRSFHSLCSIIYDPIGEYTRNTIQVRPPAPPDRELKYIPVSEAA